MPERENKIPISTFIDVRHNMRLRFQDLQRDPNEPLSPRERSVYEALKPGLDKRSLDWAIKDNAGILPIYVGRDANDDPSFETVKVTKSSRRGKYEVMYPIYLATEKQASI